LTRNARLLVGLQFVASQQKVNDLPCFVKALENDFSRHLVESQTKPQSIH